MVTFRQFYRESRAKYTWLYHLLVIAGALVISTASACSTNRSFRSQIDDVSMTNQVRALLIQDPYVNPLKVTVATDEGEVFLLGRVSNREEAGRAENHARSLGEVWSVMNYLKVGSRSDSTYGADQQLRQGIENQLFREMGIKVLNVRVLTHEGEVFLLGRVDDEVSRQQVLGVVRETDGVLAIRNHLKAGLPQLPE